MKQVRLALIGTLAAALVAILTASTQAFHEPVVVNAVEAEVVNANGRAVLHIEGLYPYGCGLGEIEVKQKFGSDPIKVNIWQNLTAEEAQIACPVEAGIADYNAEIALVQLLAPGAYNISVNGAVVRVHVP